MTNQIFLCLLFCLSSLTFISSYSIMKNSFINMRRNNVLFALPSSSSHSSRFPFLISHQNKLFGSATLRIDENLSDNYDNKVIFDSVEENTNLNLNDNLQDDHYFETDHQYDINSDSSTDSDASENIEDISQQLEQNLSNSLANHTDLSLQSHTSFLAEDLKEPGIIMLPLFNYTTTMINELTNNTFQEISTNDTSNSYYTKYHLISHVGKKDLKLIFNEYKNYLKKYSRPAKGFRPGTLSPEMLPYARIQVAIHAIEGSIKEICSQNNIIPCTKNFKPLITGEFKSTFEDLHFSEAYLKSIILKNKEGKDFNEQIKSWKEPKPLHFQAQFIGKRLIKQNLENSKKDNNEIGNKEEDKDEVIEESNDFNHEHIHDENCKH